jgi:RNA polymerase sigma-70 factor, ECF subfamily
MDLPATPLEFPATAAESAADFDSVVALYRPRIFRFALASLRDRDAAETVTQDCFLKAHRSRDSFRGECCMDSWLMRIAVNLVRDQLRNRRWRFWQRLQAAGKPMELAAGTLADGRGSPESQVLRQERVRAVWDAAAALPERQRTVFLLRFVEDLDLLEIAAATGLKEGTVKAHLFRALHAVRNRLGEVA